MCKVEFRVDGVDVTITLNSDAHALDCDPDTDNNQDCDEDSRKATIVGLSSDTPYKIEVAAQSAVIGDANQYAEISAARTQDATTVSGMAASIKGFSDSPSGKANITLKFTVGGTLPTGSSVVLFLEDDFRVRDSIPSGSVFFTFTENLGADGDETAGENMDDGTGSSGAPVFATQVAVDDADYPSPLGDDAWSIRVYIPDMETRSSNEITDVAPVNRFDEGDVVTLRITEAAGITNDPEAGKYAVGYQILTPQEDIKDDIVIDLPVDGEDELEVLAKVALSDENNKRDFPLKITAPDLTVDARPPHTS